MEDKTLEERFDERYWGLKNGELEEVYEFGYRTMRENEVFTIADWGNIKAFIKEEIIRHLEMVELDAYDSDDEGWQHAVGVVFNKIESIKESL